MNPQDRIASLSAADLNRLHDEARCRAGTLRDEAIDEFWRGVNAALWGQLSSARRAGARLSQRLQRHQRLRGASPSL
ncbi:MAG: hypothetical protein H6R06_1374 [Proteobacteria bacterium]|jgi:hypothetical protein|nr:hypothetical protein [Pseudomonadota bacterium]